MRMSFSIEIENDGSEDASLCEKTERMLESINLSPVSCTLDPSLAADVGTAIAEFINSMKAIERRANAIRKGMR